MVYEYWLWFLKSMPRWMTPYLNVLIRLSWLPAIAFVIVRWPVRGLMKARQKFYTGLPPFHRYVIVTVCICGVWAEVSVLKALLLTSWADVLVASEYFAGLSALRLIMYLLVWGNEESGGDVPKADTNEQILDGDDQHD